MAKESYELKLVEERAVARVQAMVLRLMHAKNISRSQLAENMGVSTAHISQLLGDEPRNLSVKKAARLLFALDEELRLSCKGIDELDRKANERHARLEALHRSMAAQKSSWRPANAYPANANEVCEKFEFAA